MTEPEGLLDTSTLLLLARIDPSALPDVPRISAVTLAELSVGPLVTDDAPEQARRMAHVQQAEADFEPIPFDAEAARAFGRVAASLRRSGRKPAARALDALIAARRSRTACRCIPATRTTSQASMGSTSESCHIRTRRGRPPGTGRAGPGLRLSGPISRRCAAPGRSFAPRSPGGGNCANLRLRRVRRPRPAARRR